MPHAPDVRAPRVMLSCTGCLLLLCLQVEEGEEEPEGASPHASSYVAGDSTADLAAMADGADGSLHPTGGRSQPNGAAQHSPRSPRASRPDYFSSHGPSSSTDHGRHGRTAKLPRHRIRAAVRRAPQYALEGVLGRWAWSG